MISIITMQVIISCVLNGNNVSIDTVYRFRVGVEMLLFRLEIITVPICVKLRVYMAIFLH